MYLCPSEWYRKERKGQRFSRKLKAHVGKRKIIVFEKGREQTLDFPQERKKYCEKLKADFSKIKAVVNERAGEHTIDFFKPYRGPADSTTMQDMV